MNSLLAALFSAFVVIASPIEQQTGWRLIPHQATPEVWLGGVVPSPSPVPSSLPRPTPMPVTSPRPRPIATARPTVVSVTPSPTATVQPTVSPTTVPTQPATGPTIPQGIFWITSVTPRSGKFDDEIVIKGKEFGTEPGNVWFLASNGMNTHNEGGGRVLSWTDNEIHVKVPAISGTRGLSKEFLEVEKNQVGVRTEFNVTEAIPIIRSSPMSSGPGRRIVITGDDFGSSAGEVTFFNAVGPSAALAKCEIQSWTNSEIQCVIPSTLAPAKEYFFDILTSSKTRSSSGKYIFLCEPTGCG